MTIVQQIVLWWITAGVLGTILSKFFKQPTLDEAYEELTDEEKEFGMIGKQILENKPFLEFSIDLFFGMLFLGQWDLVLFLWWIVQVFVHGLKKLVWLIKNPIHNYYVRKRLRLLAHKIKLNNIEFTQEQVDERMWEISQRWHRIKRGYEYVRETEKSE